MKTFTVTENVKIKNPDGSIRATVPVNLNGFSPQNFNREFSGAVPASEALARSLNVPSVHMLHHSLVAYA